MINDQPTNINMLVNMLNEWKATCRMVLQYDAMCVCVCVCVCVYIYIYTHIHTHTHIYTHTYNWVYVIENTENEPILYVTIFLYNNIYQDSGYLWGGREEERKIESGRIIQGASTVPILFLKKEKPVKYGKILEFDRSRWQLYGYLLRYSLNSSVILKYS